MAKAPARIALTPPARLLVFPSSPLLEKTPFIDPQTKKEKGEKKYRATFLISKSENMDAIKAQLRAAAADTNSAIPYDKWKKPIKDGNKLIEKAVAKGKSEGSLAYYKDCWVIECKTDHLPDLSIANGTPKPTPVTGEEATAAFYSGCKVLAEFNFRAYEIDSGGDEPNRFISAYHNFILKIGDGDRFGRKSRDEVFKGVMGGQSTENPLSEEDGF